MTDREKLIDLIRDSIRYKFGEAKIVGARETVAMADHLIANGVTFATDNNVGDKILCQNCTHHDTYTCPENRVWCNMLRRYMSLDGYCSYGERRNK